MWLGEIIVTYLAAQLIGYWFVRKATRKRVKEADEEKLQ